MTYNPQEDSRRSYDAAIDALRERLESFRCERIGDATLYLGDCREILPLLPKVDAVVTDPPYGIGLAGRFSGAGGFSAPIARRQYDGDWDDCMPEADAFALILKAAKQHIIWGGNYFTDLLPQGAFWLVWDKRNTMPTFSDAELAWTSIDKKSVKRIVYEQNGLMSREKERFHPTQKAVEVMQWSIKQLKAPSATILDPFMGSGTTGVACAKLGRRFIGIELEPKYFDIACKRIDDAYKQPRLFKEEPPKPKQEALL